MKRPIVWNTGILAIALILSVVWSCQREQTKSAEKGLKDYYGDKFLIGTCLNGFQFMGKDSLALDFAAKHFNTLTPENEMKWERIHPQPDVYNFVLADSMVAYGTRNNMFIVGHCLLWHSQVPQWVFQDSTGKAITRDALLARLKEHIFTVVGRYKGKVKGWDVVNEAVNEDGSLRKTKWLEIIGPDYVQKAFEFAHEADPQAELYYNDYNIELREKCAGVVTIIKALKDSGVKVDAIGIQGHWNLDKPDISEIQESFDQYDALGCKVMITEFEISVIPEPEGIVGADIAQSAEYQDKMNPYKDGFPDSLQVVLAQRYKDMFELFVKNDDKVTRVTFWGLHDGYNWKNGWPIPGRMNYPLLFDRDYKTKPAYDSVVKIVAEPTGM